MSERVRAADLQPGDLVRLDRGSGWREVGSVQVKYHVRIDGSLYYLNPDDMLERRLNPAPPASFGVSADIRARKEQDQ